VTHQPPPQAGPSAPRPGLPPGEYTPWVTRVLAWIIDYIPLGFLSAIGVVAIVTIQKIETICAADETGLGIGEVCVTGRNGPALLAWVIFALALMGALAFAVWNYGYRQGTLGSSIGKSLMGFKVVGETSGQPIGFVKSFVRQLAHAIDGIPCYLGYLWPLWDAKRQTFADKLLKTICIPT